MPASATYHFHVVFILPRISFACHTAFYRAQRLLPPPGYSIGFAVHCVRVAVARTLYARRTVWLPAFTRFGSRFYSLSAVGRIRVALPPRAGYRVYRSRTCAFSLLFWDRCRVPSCCCCNCALSAFHSRDYYRLRFCGPYRSLPRHVTFTFATTARLRYRFRAFDMAMRVTRSRSASYRRSTRFASVTRSSRCVHFHG